MIVIHINDIKIKSMSNNAGVFTGSNFEPNWDVFTKSNTNISGNNNKNNVNVIIDKDGVDFNVDADQNANQIVITEDKDGGKILISKKKDNDSKDEQTDPKEPVESQIKKASKKVSTTKENKS